MGPLGVTLDIALATALLSFACEDGTRPHLCGLGIGKGSGGTRWIAGTDGHALARTLLTGTDAPRADACYPAATVEKLIKVAKLDGATTITLTPAMWIDGVSFPPLDQVVPSPGIELNAITSLAGHLVARASKASITLSAAHGRPPHHALPLTVRALGPLDPARLDIFAEGNDRPPAAALVEIVIMPMRWLDKTNNGPTTPVDESPSSYRAKLPSGDIVALVNAHTMIDTARAERDQAETELAKVRESLAHWEAEASEARDQAASLALDLTTARADATGLALRLASMTEGRDRALGQCSELAGDLAQSLVCKATGPVEDGLTRIAHVPAYRSPVAPVATVRATYRPSGILARPMRAGV